MRTTHYVSKTFWNPKFLFSLILLLVTSWTTFAQINVVVEKTNATYEVGDTVVFNVTANSGGTVNWGLKYDTDAPLISSGSFSISANQTETITHVSTEPGVIVCEVTKSGGGYAAAAAAVSPFEIEPFTNEPADFDAFWDGKKSDLAAVPINPVITFYQTNSWSTTYRVELDNIDGRTVYGFMVVPNGTGPFPAIVEMPPYGNTSGLAIPAVSLAEQGGVIVLSITIHNSPPDQTAPNAYIPDNFADEDENYYRWGILAGIRSIDYLMTRSDLDGDNIGVCGVSQGAGLSTIVAGLDDRVKLLAMSNPVLCQNAGLVYDRAGGFPNYVEISRTNFGTTAHEAATINATKYYDVMFHARRYDGPVYANLGYEDLVTPAATGFAAVNQLSGKKIFQHSINLGHPHPFEYWIKRQDFIRRVFPTALTSHSFPWSSNDQGYWVDAGDDQTTNGNSVNLTATLEKNGSINPSFDLQWKKLSGPGSVTFSDSSAYNTTATFSLAGDYVLEFSGVDEAQLVGEQKFFTISDRINVTAESGGNNNTPPSIAISTDSTEVTIPFEVDVVFSENVIGFDLADINVTNGVASNLIGTDSLYSFTITPTIIGAITVMISSFSVLDDEGAENETPSNVISVNFTDLNANIPPTILIGTDSTEVTVPFLVVAIFSENVTGLDLNDINVVNGTASNLLGSDSVYVFTVTPTITGVVGVSISSFSVIDDEGAGNETPSNTLNVNYTEPSSGNILPTVSIATDSTEVTVPFEVEVVFSENVTGFDLGDIDVANGVASNLTGVDSLYSFTITPTVSGAVTVFISEFSVLDDEDADNETPSNTLNVNYTEPSSGNILPTVSIATDSTEVTVPFEVEVVFSENVTGFDLGDIDVTNGVASNLTGVDSLYSFTITPTVSGAVAIFISEFSVLDDEGANNETPSNTLNVNYTEPSSGNILPTVSIATDSTEVTVPFEVEVVFSENVTGFDLGDIDVTNGVASNLLGTDSLYTFTVTPTVEGGVSVFISSFSVLDDDLAANETPSNTLNINYAEPGSGNILPTVSISTDSVEVTVPFEVDVVFSENVTGFDLGDIDMNNGVASNLLGTDSLYTFTVTPTVEGGVSVFISTFSVLDDEGADNETPSNILNINYTEPNGNDCTNPTNLALGKPATQSGTQVNAEPSRAVDGNSDGNFWAGNSVTLTNWVTNAWWEVDLLSISQINEIRVWNRSDCCDNLFADFYILVSNTPFTSQDLNTTLNQSGVNSYFVSGTAGYPTAETINASGRYVRVQLLGSAFLAIAEVEVLGCIASGGTPLDQTITFDPLQDKLTVDAPFDISANASSALPVDFSIVSGPATISNNTITLDGVEGTVVVRASQAGNAQYNSAPDVDQSFEVTEPPVGSCGIVSNMALNKPSTQSGTQLNGTPDRVNDGNTDGNFWTGNSVNLTNWVTNSWWETDMQVLANIETINVWNRSDCCSDKLSNFYVFVSDVPFTSQDLNTTLNQPGVSSFLQNGEAGFPTTVFVNRTGRFVRVQLSNAAFLTMAEVEVMGCIDTGGGPLDQIITFDPIDDKLVTDAPFDIFASSNSGLPVDFSIVSGPATISNNTITLDGIEGTVVVRASQAGNTNFNPAIDVDQSFEVTLPPPALCTSTSNIAIGKTATQSGTQVSAGADRAVDGNTDGNFWTGNSVSLTNWIPNAWWEVDLETIQNIDQINVWNRTDCCTDKFSNFYVFVSDVPFTSTDLNTTLSQTGVDNYYVDGEAGYPTELPIIRTGQYVRVQLAGTAYLSIAEVEILGCEISNGFANNASTLIVQPDVLHFEAKKNQRNVQLTWATNTEFENDFFTIEKSRDGENFELFQSIESKTDDNGIHFYQDVDDAPFFGKNYYRLMRVEKDSTESYSEMMEVDFEIDWNEFSIFPNPANEYLSLNLKPFLGKEMHLQILDARGVLRLEKNISQEDLSSVQSFDLEKFNNGLYILTVKVEGLKMLTRQFVIARPY